MKSFNKSTDLEKTLRGSGVSRREFLKVGALAVGGLTLADLLRLKAHGNAETSAKAVPVFSMPGTMQALFPKSCATGRSQSFGATKPVTVYVPGTDADSDPYS